MTTSSWVSDLDAALEQAGFQLKDQNNHAFCQNMTHLCTRTYLMALAEILSGIKRTCAKDLTPVVSDCEETLAQLMQDTAGELVYNWRPVVVLAQKSQQLMRTV